MKKKLYYSKYKWNIKNIGIEIFLHLISSNNFKISTLKLNSIKNYFHSQTTKIIAKKNYLYLQDANYKLILYVLYNMAPVNILRINMNKTSDNAYNYSLNTRKNCMTLLKNLKTKSSIKNKN